MSSDKSERKRRNKAIDLSEAIGSVLEPALRKRGFASRDIIAHWAAIVPAPFDGATVPDKLAWPRGERADGAVLHLRCDPAHRLALAHEEQRLVQAINRYYGYVLVSGIRISPMPLERQRPEPVLLAGSGEEVLRARVGRSVRGVADEGLREALARLGRGVLARRKP